MLRRCWSLSSLYSKTSWTGSHGNLQTAKVWQQWQEWIEGLKKNTEHTICSQSDCQDKQQKYVWRWVGQIAGRFQTDDQSVQFGFSYKLRKFLAHSVVRIKGREGSTCTGYVFISFSSSSQSWLLMQTKKETKWLLVWSCVAALSHLLLLHLFPFGHGPCISRSAGTKVSVKGRFISS